MCFEARLCIFMGVFLPSFKKCSGKDLLLFIKRGKAQRDSCRVKTENFGIITYA